MKAINLTTEYLTNPIGIDIVKPHLFWNCEGGIKQTAYQVVAKVNDEIVFDTGKVTSSSMRCVYDGKTLQSRDIVVLSVILWDENDVQGEASEASFEIGLLNKEDWSAKWISGDYRPKARKQALAPYLGKAPKKEKVDYFYKTFELKTIKKGRLYITACGVYEVFINEKRVGEFVMAPGYTDYTKRIQYQVYDVTDLLKVGQNEIKVILADGWYRGSTG
ncbi:MAG: alpha-L-rhamnosidase N-terminal domain-containing protein, partial [Bacilli bacterium]|nr:alpha-L-rhamnosidase N-terminal domain-containing protein [Bacilli bacterium]